MREPALFTRAEFARMDENFRIGAIVADGMWWPVEKWANHAKVDTKTLYRWITANLANGRLEQSETGARSYRFPLESIKSWYHEHGYTIETRLVEFLFPPRIWDGLTEIDGFATAPLRETGTVKFTCSPGVAQEVREALQGVARVREEKPGEYRAFCLSSMYAKSIITSVFDKHELSDKGTTHSRMKVMRRELADLPPAFASGLVSFYQSFAMTLAKGAMETIKIYLPDREDQVSQITYWVITAIEKFDERSSVPFSGYLNSALIHWPYDLPHDYLGKDLAAFQRERSKALKKLRKASEDPEGNFSHTELADAMGIEKSDFADLESKHRVWLGSRNATTLTWDQTSDEKLVKENITGGFDKPAAPTDLELAHKLSSAIVFAAIDTGNYRDAFALISQIDSTDLDRSKIAEADPEFIVALGKHLGVDV